MFIEKIQKISPIFIYFLKYCYIHIIVKNLYATTYPETCVFPAFYKEINFVIRVEYS